MGIRRQNPPKLFKKSSGTESFMGEEIKSVKMCGSPVTQWSLSQKNAKRFDLSVT